ncbi:response regulator transcription factor [Oleisolibacter albus]|uniref:response regulator transcription factor n=1 Tax=Oleisolibacter albus TaxID=2171757 RepID=UPI000DF35C94|nr:response regulator transcription factor [Oleisolibacter albus]
MSGVLIIDDHPIVLQGFRRLVESHGVGQVFTTSCLLEAFRIYRRTFPDILVLDLSIGRRRLAGVGFLRRFRSVDKHTPILIFSMHDDPVIVRKALAAGATGYIHKDAPPAEIDRAFTTVKAGQPFIGPDLAMEVALLSRLHERPDLRDLTRREADVLGLLAEGRSYSAIADELGVSYKTIANICSILKSKLEAETLPDLIYKAVQRFTIPPQARSSPRAGRA